MPGDKDRQRRNSGSQAELSSHLTWPKHLHSSKLDTLQEEEEEQPQSSSAAALQPSKQLKQHKAPKAVTDAIPEAFERGNDDAAVKRTKRGRARKGPAVAGGDEDLVGDENAPSAALTKEQRKAKQPQRAVANVDASQDAGWAAASTSAAAAARATVGNAAAAGPAAASTSAAAASRSADAPKPGKATAAAPPAAARARQDADSDSEADWDAEEPGSESSQEDDWQPRAAAPKGSKAKRDAGSRCEC